MVVGALCWWKKKKKEMSCLAVTPDLAVLRSAAAVPIPSYLDAPFRLRSRRSQRRNFVVWTQSISC
jgi:hypothetical protein